MEQFIWGVFSVGIAIGGILMWLMLIGCDKKLSKDSLPLADVDWLNLGNTDEHKELKERIQYICADVRDAGCIAEICINDIAITFRQYGYEIIKKKQ